MSGFESPNWTMMPNDLIDVWMCRMEGSELKVVLAVLRLTVGYHRADVQVSVAQIRRLTGLAKCSIIIGAEAAEAHGLLLRYRYGNGRTTWTPNIPDYVRRSRIWSVWCDGEGNLPSGSFGKPA
jgi:hypothetical protein